MAKHADKALAARRVDDILRIRLDGAQWWDVREFVREKEKEQGSAWFVAEGEEALSDSQIRRYQTRADTLMMRSHERSRKKLFRRHLAQRRNLFARAVRTGDTATALRVLQDEAELCGLYPAKRHEVRGKDGGPVQLHITEEIIGRPAPAELPGIVEEVIAHDGTSGSVSTEADGPPALCPAGVPAQ
jgi:hypothetical protein